MRSYLQFITTPTADTPGTLLYLHYDDRRYLIGQVAEGTQRACNQRGIALRKVSDVILTGRTQWATTGGLLGLVLNLADIKIGAVAAATEDYATKKNTRKLDTRARRLERENLRLRVHGGPNLNYSIAASRRFTFRTGMPIDAVDINTTEAQVSPTWTDNRIQVWAMLISPSTSDRDKSQGLESPGRKRSFHNMSQEKQNSEHEELLLANTTCTQAAESVVKQMFNSNWRYDTFIWQPLSQIRMPAIAYTKDPVTDELVEYNGAMPGGSEPVANISVLVREPWPGAETETLPPTKPASESISYIIRNHAQRGRFMPEKATELEVEKGPLWSKLTHGFTVQNVHGRNITPEMVLQPGKQGGGFAILDLPQVDYVVPLIERPELRNATIMDGVGAMVWILGPGVAADARLRQFQQEMSHLEHIVASPDCCPDALVLESAVNSAWRHNRAVPDAFPKLVTSRNELSGMEMPSKIIPARRGLTLGLEPHFEIETDHIAPSLNTHELETSIDKEMRSIQEAFPDMVLLANTSKTREWHRELPHGEAQIITLGTGSSHPSVHRNVAGTLIRVPGCGSYLFDAGEGTLGTLKRLYTSTELNSVLADLRMIWISHMHADHHLGLTSVIRAWYYAVHNGIPAAPNSWHDFSESKIAVVSEPTMLDWLYEYSGVEDFGYSRILPLATTPIENAAYKYKNLLESCELRLVTAAAQAFQQRNKTAEYLRRLSLVSLAAVHVSHCRGAQAVAITFSGGFKVSYSGDCRPSADFAAIGRNSHVLVHEATFEDDMRVEAIAKKHSTVGEALVVACKMEAQACVLTHFSQRYPAMPQVWTRTLKNEQLSSFAALTGSSSDVINTVNVTSMTDSIAYDQRRGGTTSTVSYTDHRELIDDKELSDDYKWYIRRNEISRIINERGMKVVCAFDYMRVRVADLATLHSKQPLLRAIYDGIAGKDSLPKIDELETLQCLSENASNYSPKKQKAGFRGRSTSGRGKG